MYRFEIAVDSAQFPVDSCLGIHFYFFLLYTVFWKVGFAVGLIKAGMGVLGGTLADERKEYSYYEGMGKEVMVTKSRRLWQA